MNQFKKFAIPFNGIDVDSYLKEISKYKNNIEEIYLGVPSLIQNNKNVLYRNCNNIEYVLQYERNVYEFLEKSKGLYKRLLTINAPFYDWPREEKILWVETKLKPLCVYYSVEGIIISDYELAQIIRERFPDLEMQTSCNTFSYLPSTYKFWHDECGAVVFNPPREIMRDFDLLKLFSENVKSFGGKLKCLISDTCIYGCPAMISHTSYVAVKNRDYCFNKFYCVEQFKFSNFLKSNWILPRHLNKFSDYVDIFKITGRDLDEKDLFQKLDYWINERDDIEDITDVVVNGVISKKIKSYGDIKIRSKDIPDKIIFCDHNCSKCDICNKISEKIIKRSYENNLIKPEYSLEDMIKLI